MFIVELTYKVPLEEIDQHLEAHNIFLKKYYDSEHFVMSGRKNPRDGGIILVRAESRQVIEKIISEDPFHIHRLADYTITEFIPSMMAKGCTMPL